MEDDGDDRDDSKRRTRNLSEKKRRDQFNSLIRELATMISSNRRKMDKTTVLRTAISFLKHHNELILRSKVHDVPEDWKPSYLSNEEFTYLLLEALEGFIMVFSGSGRICYVSEGITSLLGHNPDDIVNRSLFDLAFEKDHHNLYRLLQNGTQGMITEVEMKFKCHLRRGPLDCGDDVKYELVQFNGHFRINAERIESDMSFQEEQDSRILFLCTGKVCTPQLIRDVSLVGLHRNEFTSRHSLEWKFLFLDHRAPQIIGYLPFEVLGTSGYDYYHFDDLEKVVTCHEELMQKGELTSCNYRFLTKGQQWIWLQTRFYITYHQWSSKPEFVVCTHRVVSNAEGETCPKKEITQTDSQGETAIIQSVLKEPPPEQPMAVSPSYVSEANEPLDSSYRSQPPSEKSVATSGSTSRTVGTAGTSSASLAPWATRSSLLHSEAASDTASVSGESRPPQPNNTQETPTVQEQPVVPQYGIGAQYLEPVPYVGAVGMPGMMSLSLPQLPVIVAPDQAQLQEQLQRAHRELQQMIARQQAELRQVKDKLLLARLGIYQPVITVQDPYGNMEELHHSPAVSQILYDGIQARPLTAYPPQQLQPPPQQLQQPPPQQLQQPPPQQLQQPPPQQLQQPPPQQLQQPPPQPGHHPQQQNQNQYPQ